MATRTRKSKNSSSEFGCKWCNREFKSERTLSAHMCPKKRRHADRDLKHIQLAFWVFKRFYELTTTSAPRTMDDFINSQFYAGFAKFGRACLVNEYLNPEQYAEWLIREGKRLDKWATDSVYDEYLMAYIRKEPGLKALERTVHYLSTWSEETGHPWNKYFVEVSPNRAVYDLRAGKVSPWVLYLGQTGDQLLVKLNDEQVNMVSPIIDANFWFPLFKKSGEVDEVMAICEAGGI